MNQTWGQAHHQFVLQRGTSDGPEGWVHRASAGWALAHHPSLPVTDLIAPDGTTTGWVLGWMVTPDGRFAADGHHVAGTTPEMVEALLDTCAGRYAVVLLTPGLERMYLDPCGTLAAVFRSRSRRLASTVTAALWDEPDHPVFSRPRDAFPASGANQYFPAGLTAAADVRRLLPNHYLDLARWEAVRHYPRDELAPLSDRAVDEAIEAVIASVSHTLAAYARAYPHLYLGLTVGRDTRTLIACARPVLDQVELVTFDYRGVRSDRNDRTDVFAWRRLMGDTPVRKHLLAVGAATDAQEDDYLWRIGWAGGPGKVRDFHTACRTRLDLAGVWVTGFAGETGRSPYAEGIDLSRPVAPEVLLRCLRVEQPGFDSPMRDWYDGVAHLTPVSTFDLAFLEHRVGGWASPHMYGAAPFAATVVPLASRVVQDAMLRFPLHVKFGRDVIQDLVTRTWPELAAFPVEGFTGWRRPVEAARGALGERRAQRRVRARAGVGAGIRVAPVAGAGSATTR